MGLTIHFSLRLPEAWSPDQVTAAIAGLWQSLKALPFQAQTSMVTLDARRIRLAQAAASRSPWRWACIQHCRQVPVGGHQPARSWCSVPPQMLVGFTCQPGAGCEPLNLFVGRFQTRISHDGVIYPLDQPLRWTGAAFCKTQYASRPEEGGITNFLRCHLLVIAALDAAKDLGFEVEVTDEGGYWTNRSIPALVQEVGDWNAFICGITQDLKAVLGDRVAAALCQADLDQPVDATVVKALGDDVLDLIRRTRGTTAETCTTGQPQTGA